MIPGIIADFEKFEPDILLEDGADLADHGFDARVLHLPGHTRGSIGILAEGCGLIAGDVYSNKKEPEIADNAVDYDLLMKSAGKAKSTGARNIYPGHGLPFSL